MTHLDNDQQSQYHTITKPAYRKDEWDHDYYAFIDTVDANLKKSNTLANRPATGDAPDNSWYEATDEDTIYRNDSNDGWVPVAYGNDASPTWSSSHTFDSGLSMGASLDLAGNSLTDSTQDYLDLTSGKDIRVSEGRGIEDTNGNVRLSVFTDTTTRIYDGSEKLKFNASGAVASINAYSGEPVEIFDQEGGFTAVQYDTDASEGTLSFPNAVPLLNSTDPYLALRDDPDMASGDEWRVLAQAGTSANASLSLSFYDDSAATYEKYLVVKRAGPVDISRQPKNLRLATGQAIEDGGGTNRLALRANDTELYNSNGAVGVDLDGGTYHRIHAYSGVPVVIQDGEGGFQAVKYTTSSSAPGTLDLERADLDMGGNSITNAGSVSTGEASIGPITLDKEELDDIPNDNVDTYDFSNSVANNAMIYITTPDRERKNGLVVVARNEINTGALGSDTTNQGNTTLSGTSGPDGMLNLAVDSTTLYIENRTNAQINVDIFELF